MDDDCNEMDDSLELLAASVEFLRPLKDRIDQEPYPLHDGGLNLDDVVQFLIGMFLEQHIELAEQAISLKSDIECNGVGSAVIRASRSLLSARRFADKYKLVEADFTRFSLDAKMVRMHCDAINNMCSVFLSFAAKLTSQRRIDGAALYRELHNPSPMNNSDAEYVLAVLESAIEEENRTESDTETSFDEADIESSGEHEANAREAAASDNRLFVRPVRVADVAKAINKRSDKVLSTLRSGNRRIGGTRRTYIVEFADVVATYPHLSKRLNEWADKNYPQ